METTPHNDSMKKNILGKIKEGDVTMQPKSYFLMRLLLTLICAVGVLVLSSLLLSFTLFSLHESGELFLLGFGLRGIATFLALFPWTLLAFTAAFVVVLWWLLRGFKQTYRLPIFYGFLVLCLVTLSASILINTTPLHSELLEHSRSNEDEFFSTWYRNITIPAEEQGEFRGKVVAVEKQNIVISHDDGDGDYDDGVRTVILPRDAAELGIVVGDIVYVAGDQDGTTIYAYGVHKLPQ